MDIIIAAIGLLGFGVLQIIKAFVALRCSKHCKKCKRIKNKCEND